MWNNPTKGYNLVPALPAVAITEEMAMRDNGYKVHIGPPNNKTGHRQFKVHRLDSSSSFSLFASIKHTLLALAGITIIMSAVGALFLGVGGVKRLEYYMNFPAANCTVTYISGMQTYKSSNFYYVDVQYYDTDNVSHTKEMSIGIHDMSAWNIKVGTSFTCLYKGNILQAKDTIERELNTNKQYWWLGFFIPLAISVMFGSIYLFSYCIIQKTSTNVFYPPTVSFRDDHSLVINDWASIPTQAHNLFYLLLYTYYTSLQETPTGVRNVSFHVPKKDSAKTITVTLKIMGVFAIALFLGMLGGAGFMFCLQPSFVLFCTALFLGIDSFAFLGVAVYCFQVGMRDRFSVDTEDFNFMVSVGDGEIVGHFKKDNSERVALLRAMNKV